MRLSEQLNRFVRESNQIEGIHRDPTEGELTAHAAFLPLLTVTVADMESFVREVAARPLRRAIGQDVYVGDHCPPPGGPGVEDALRRLLHRVEQEPITPYEAHVAYELLHPFIDGNGRSGRVLWAWMMKRDGHDPFALPFLHRWYYQTLDAARR